MWPSRVMAGNQCLTHPVLLEEDGVAESQGRGQRQCLLDSSREGRAYPYDYWKSRFAICLSLSYFWHPVWNWRNGWAGVGDCGPVTHIAIRSMHAGQLSLN